MSPSHVLVSQEKVALVYLLIKSLLMSNTDSWLKNYEDKINHMLLRMTLSMFNNYVYLCGQWIYFYLLHWPLNTAVNVYVHSSVPGPQYHTGTRELTALPIHSLVYLWEFTTCVSGDWLAWWCCPVTAYAMGSFLKEWGNHTKHTCSVCVLRMPNL